MTRIYTYPELQAEFGKDMAHLLDGLVEHQGHGEFVLVRAAFQRGGEISRHQSLRAALREMRRLANAHDGTRIVFGVRYGGQGCQCGGPRIVTDTEYDRLPTAKSAPSAYSAAR